MQSMRRATLLSSSPTEPQLGDSGPASRTSTGPEIPALGKPAICAHGGRGYRTGLATFELVAEIRGLLATERQAERLVCRYLADLADRIQARQHAELSAYDDELDAARLLFGLGARETRERVRVGRALRNLPEIERAFIGGELSYSRVREVTRVATADTEPNWLELSRQLDMRSLERRVAAGRAASSEEFDRHGEQRPGEHTRARRVGADRVRVTFELSIETWTLLERAMEEARRTGTFGPSDSDALEAVARAALHGSRDDPSDAGNEPRRCEWPIWDEGEGRTAALGPDEPVAEEPGPDEPVAEEPGSDEPVAEEPGLTIAEPRGCGELARDGTALEIGAESTEGQSAEKHRPKATQSGSSGRAPAPCDRQIDAERFGSGFVDEAGEPATRLMHIM